MLTSERYTVTDLFCGAGMIRRPYVPRCGPCHRARGGVGLPSMAIPSRPDLDDQGGIHGFCAGSEIGKEHTVHVDHLGEPFDEARLAEIRERRADFADPMPGHTLIR